MIEEVQDNTAKQNFNELALNNQSITKKIIRYKIKKVTKPNLIDESAFSRSISDQIHINDGSTGALPSLTRNTEEFPPKNEAVTQSQIQLYPFDSRKVVFKKKSQAHKKQLVVCSKVDLNDEDQTNSKLNKDRVDRLFYSQTPEGFLDPKPSTIDPSLLNQTLSSNKPQGSPMIRVNSKGEVLKRSIVGNSQIFQKQYERNILQPPKAMIQNQRIPNQCQTLHSRFSSQQNTNSIMTGDGSTGGSFNSRQPVVQIKLNQLPQIKTSAPRVNRGQKAYKRDQYQDCDDQNISEMIHAYKERKFNSEERERQYINNLTLPQKNIENKHSSLLINYAKKQKEWSAMNQHISAKIGKDLSKTMDARALQFRETKEIKDFKHNNESFYDKLKGNQENFNLLLRSSINIKDLKEETVAQKFKPNFSMTGGSGSTKPPLPDQLMTPKSRQIKKFIDKDVEVIRRPQISGSSGALETVKLKSSSNSQNFRKDLRSIMEGSLTPRRLKEITSKQSSQDLAIAGFNKIDSEISCARQISGRKILLKNHYYNDDGEGEPSQDEIVIEEN